MGPHRVEVNLHQDEFEVKKIPSPVREKKQLFENIFKQEDHSIASRMQRGELGDLVKQRHEWIESEHNKKNSARFLKKKHAGVYRCAAFKLFNVETRDEDSVCPSVMATPKLMERAPEEVRDEVEDIVEDEEDTETMDTSEAIAEASTTGEIFLTDTMMALPDKPQDSAVNEDTREDSSTQTEEEEKEEVKSVGSIVAKLEGKKTDLAREEALETKSVTTVKSTSSRKSKARSIILVVTGASKAKKVIVEQEDQPDTRSVATAKSSSSRKTKVAEQKEDQQLETKSVMTAKSMASKKSKTKSTSTTNEKEDDKTETKSVSSKKSKDKSVGTSKSATSKNSKTSTKSKRSAMSAMDQTLYDPTTSPIPAISFDQTEAKTADLDMIMNLDTGYRTSPENVPEETNIHEGPKVNVTVVQNDPLIVTETAIVPITNQEDEDEWKLVRVDSQGVCSARCLETSCKIL